MPSYIVFVRGSAKAEAAQKPEPGMMEAMGVFNARMVEAGIMLSAEGLLPSSRDSHRIAFHDSMEPIVKSGPFPPNEIVSGFWILKAKDVDEVVNWMKECPMQDGDVLEVRRIAAAEDFGDAFSPEMREKEEETRERIRKLAE